jgi:hypothetical protein
MFLADGSKNANCAEAPEEEYAGVAATSRHP